MNAKERFLWQHGVHADAELTHAQKSVLTRLALHLNIENGRCDPSVGGLAAETNVTRRTVQRALARGEALGWITREPGGGQRRSRYSLTQRQPLSGDAPQPVNGRSPVSGVSPHPRQACHLTRVTPVVLPASGVTPEQSKRTRKGTGRERGGASRDDANKNFSAGNKPAYAFEGQVIHVRPAELERWKRAFPDIPDVEAVLEHCDGYMADHPSKDGKWFHRALGWLKNENAKYAEKRRAIERERDSW
jgi:MarR family protein